MAIKMSDKSTQQLSNILYLLGKNNANHVIAQMINVFELDLANKPSKASTGSLAPR